MKILVVDDEAMIREWMSFAIGKLPIDVARVDTAADGIEALKLLREEVYDLVFVDVMMPKMNGIELIKEINNLSELPMVVVLSSHDQFDYARKALLYHASEYVLKSECSKEKLLELLTVCHEKMEARQSIQKNSPKDAHTETLASELKSEWSNYVQEALQFIHAHYADINNIAEISNHVHLNTDYFSRLFRKEVGLPASTYLMNYKLDKAAKQILETTVPISEISQQVGYSNISYFSKIFKERFGMKPIHYRRRPKER